MHAGAPRIKPSRIKASPMTPINATLYEGSSAPGKLDSVDN
jgi:hypothetical protein|tara:strand:+ start:322 stop:444 length:123 start_codon:yes stop_codon:yes gene_type:complete